MYVFVGTEIMIYFIFIILDIMHLPSAELKYISIILCLAMAVYLFVTRHSKLILIGMVLTLFADTFLLLMDDYYVIGVLAFCVVQTLYAARLMKESDGKTVLPRLFLFFTALAVLEGIGTADILTIAAAWSFTQLFINVIHALVLRKRFQGGNLFCLGLILFLCCDTCVGLNNLFIYFPRFFYPQLISAASFCMWVFYLPAQVLIVLSFWNPKEQREKNQRKDEENHERK